MKGAFVIFRREFSLLWTGPFAWLLLLGFSVVEGGVFAASVTQSVRTPSDEASPLALFFGQDSLLLVMLLLVLCPALGMRTFAEERKTGSLEHLLAAPLASGALTFGKYLAPLATYAVIWATTLAYPLALGTVDDVDLPALGTSYLGVLVVGASHLAVGVLASALATNQLSAFFGAAFALFGLYVFSLGEFLFDDGPLRALASSASLGTFLDECARGVLDVRRFVFHLSLTLFLLFWTSCLVDSWREE